MQKFSALSFAVFPLTLAKSILLLSCLFISSYANAGQVLLSALKDLTPLADAVLKVDNERIFLSSTGTAAFELNAGIYEASLQQYGQQLLVFKFELTEAENAADISVMLEEGLEPQVDIKRYTANSEKLKSPGVISGFITSKDSGEAISGVVISDESGQYSTTSKDDGSFELKLLRGQYDLRIASPEFALVKVNKFTVLADSFLELNISMGKEGAENLEEVLAIGSFIADSVTASERDSSAVLDVIGAEQFSRFGDSSAASALQRVAGVSILDGQFAVVRGMSGRYVASTLNGNVTPSTDPTRRDAPLDLFPSSILSSIDIQKSFSADLPADSTGGNVKLNTKGLPDEAASKLSFAIGGNSEVTFKNVDSYDGSSTDFLGFDGDRDLPGRIESASKGGLAAIQLDNTGSLPNGFTSAEIETLGETLPVNYKVTQTRANPNVSIAYSTGNRIKKDDKDFAYYGALSYGNKWEKRANGVSNDLTIVSNKLQIEDSYDFSRVRNNISLAGYFVAGFEWEDSSQVLSKTMLSRKSENTVKTSGGFSDDTGLFENATSLEWVERQYLSQQFSGLHFPFAERKDIEVSWRSAYSATDRIEPDRRFYEYNSSDNINYIFSTASLERRWSDLNETSLDLGADIKIPFQLADRIMSEAKFGVNVFDRDRDSEIQRYTFNVNANSSVGGVTPDLSDPNPNNIVNADTIGPNDQQFTLQNQSNAQDYYSAAWQMIALYTSIDFDFDSLYKLTTGLRFEDSTQSVETTPAGSPFGSSQTKDLDSSDIFPTITFTWLPTESWQFRSGYSKTVSRPDFTELSNARFTDPILDFNVTGNPNLENSYIDNFDLRAEYYFSEEDSITLALFYKDIEKPIEQVLKRGSGSVGDIRSFENSEEAQVSGLEIDFRKHVYDSGKFATFVGGNFALIDSEVTLSAQAAQEEGQSSRELQGQSPYLVNFQLGVDHYMTAQEFTLLFNQFGERISEVGRSDLPNVNEQPFTQLDFVYKYIPSDQFEVKAKLGNILDADVEFTQGGLIKQKYNKGIDVEVGLSYQF